MQTFSSRRLLSHSFCSWSVQWHRGLIALWELIRGNYVFQSMQCSFYLLFFPALVCQENFYWPHRAYGGYNKEIRSVSASVSQNSWCFCSMRSVLTTNRVFTFISVILKQFVMSLTLLQSSWHMKLQFPVKTQINLESDDPSIHIL